MTEPIIELARPTLGQIVHYTLSATDASLISIDRSKSGIQGNPVAEGQVYPAMVVWTREDGAGQAVNLQVFVDGPDAYWATSRLLGETPGTWAWPAQS